MMHTPMPPNFDEVYQRKLEEQYATLAEYVDNGRCKDHADYKCMTGQMLGLMASINCFKELVSKFQKE